MKSEGKSMSRKMARYSTELKTKVVLEVLKEEKTLNEIASAYSINPANLKNQKKIFLENASVAMEPAKTVKEYKEENAKLKAKLDEYAKTVGRLTVEKEWAVGELQSLDSSYKKELSLRAILAVRASNTSWADIQHPKHSYKLRGLDIVRANQVWSTDITYIKIKGGMVYMKHFHSMVSLRYLILIKDLNIQAISTLRP